MLAKWGQTHLIALGIGCLTLASLSAIAILNHQTIVNVVAGWDIPQVSVEELQQDKYQNIVLVDVRSPEEYAENRTPNSILVLLSDIQADFGIKQIYEAADARKQAGQPNPTIVLYSTSGLQAFQAYRRLESVGIRDYPIVVLTGGSPVVPPKPNLVIYSVF
uniref:Rhodanese-like domain-containing protein n=1 Tax=Desertifilum tharense IPPAS B-1220 TaxID=1781255 RepID=A0ACD5GNQ6_9CYAN